MIGGGEEPSLLVVGVAGGVRWAGPGCGLGGVVSQPPIRPPARAGAMTVSSGDRAVQSVRRARQRPAQGILRARPGPGDPSWSGHRVPVWGTAAGAVVWLAGASASVSRCQARVASLRAAAVVAIFFPRRLAMAW